MTLTSDDPAWPRQEALADAAAWLARLRSDDLSSDDERGFRAWLERHPEHGAAFDAISTVWETTGHPAIVPAAPVETRGMTRRYALVGAAAALAIGAGGLAWYNRAAQAYATGPGEVRHIALDDGSSVLLDADSRIEVAFSKQKRSIALTEGRAHFDVATDPLRPFVVEAAKQQVVALGTAFDVSKDGDEDMSVILLHGRVAVQPLASAGPAGYSREILEPGERFRVKAARLVQKDQPNVAAASAWQSGRAVFDGTALSEAAAEMNRYSKRPIVISGERLQSAQISGSYSTGNPEAFTKSAALLLGAEVRSEPDRLVIYEPAQ